MSLYVDFDANDGAPIDETNFKNNQGAITVSCWSPCRYRVPDYNRNKAFSERYVRIAEIVGDLKTYDMGKLWIAAKGQGQPSWVLGDIYFRYRISFRTPQMKDIAMSQESSTHTPSTTQPFLNASTKGQTLAQETNGSTWIFLKPGYYSVLLTAAATSVAAWAISSYGSAAVQAIHDAVDDVRDISMRWFKLFVPDNNSSGFSATMPTASGFDHTDMNITKISKEEYESEL